MVNEKDEKHYPFFDDRTENIHYKNSRSNILLDKALEKSLFHNYF